MMQIFHNAWDEVYSKIDCVDAFKKTMMTFVFDDSKRSFSQQETDGPCWQGDVSV